MNTSDGILEINRHFEFSTSDKYIRITNYINNISENFKPQIIIDKIKDLSKKLDKKSVYIRWLITKKNDF